MRPEIHVNQSDHVSAMAQAVLEHCHEKQWSLSTAESLTAGMLCSTLCNIAGASAVVRGGVIAYADDIKTVVLGVSKDRIEENSAVDSLVSEQMAQGVCKHIQADIGIATTGVAGPDVVGDHPVGEVHIAVVTPEGGAQQRFEFQGDRAAIRQQTVEAALSLTLKLLSGNLS